MTDALASAAVLLLCCALATPVFAQTSDGPPCDAALADHVRGVTANVHPGQFGQTIIQLPDRYYEGSCMSWAENHGQWRPLPVSETMPTKAGEVDGEVVWDARGFARWVWENGNRRWLDYEADDEDHEVGPVIP